MPNSARSGPAGSPAVSIEELARLSGIRSEHVLLEGEETSALTVGTGRTARRRFGYANHARGIEAVLTLFDDGHLGVTERRSGRRRRTADLDLDLRYVDPRPVRSWHAKRALLRSASLLAGLLAVVGSLAYLLPVSAAALFLVASIAGILAVSWSFATRLERRVAFRTRHGRATVLSFVASYGCLRRCRLLSRELTAAIREACAKDTRDTAQFLRGEIREHYRLAETGALSSEACTRAVRKALRHFG